MLTKEEIINYHLSGSQPNDSYGFEFEVFCINKQLDRLFYIEDHTNTLFRAFNYLINNNGFKALSRSKTIGVKKHGSKFTLEPGSQLEYAAKVHLTPETMIIEFFDLLKIYRLLQNRCHLKITDFSLFPFQLQPFQLLNAARFQAMDAYFKQIGEFGRAMMQDTASLQLTFGYESRKDLEKKVYRLLFLKPILLLISSNSRINLGKDSGYHSYREVVWQNTDDGRCNDPGGSFWDEDQWTIEHYIEKVLEANVIFDVVNKQYKEVPEKPFRNFLNASDIESYIFHNSTMYTDIRIKQYIEIRYLDNPGILLFPGVILLIHNIFYNDKIWQLLLEKLPYCFSEVPEITQRLNKIDRESTSLWNTSCKPVLIRVIDELKALYPPNYSLHFDPIIEKIDQVGDAINLEMNPNEYLANSIREFDDNLSKLLARNSLANDSFSTAIRPLEAPLPV